MKRIFVLAAALLMISSASNATGKEMDAKAANNAPTVVAGTTAATAGMTELMKENQLLKLELQNANKNFEALSNKLDYSHNMHFATVNLYESQLQQQENDANDKVGYAWMMHNVIINLTNALNASKK